MVEREQLKGTPFYLVKEHEQWFLTMGQYKITEAATTREAAQEKLLTEKWLIIMHMIIIVIEQDKFTQREALDKYENS